MCADVLGASFYGADLSNAKLGFWNFKASDFREANTYMSVGGKAQFRFLCEEPWCRRPSKQQVLP